MIPAEGVAWHCVDIDGFYWHRPGECTWPGCKCCKAPELETQLAPDTADASPELPGKGALEPIQ